MRHFVTFGQEHVHRINDQTLDAHCVACFTADDVAAGRARAFELFGPQFCFHYTEEEFDWESLRFFPRGIIDLDLGA